MRDMIVSVQDLRYNKRRYEKSLISQAPCLHNGRGGENRTPTNGFGDRRTTIILHP